MTSTVDALSGAILALNTLIEPDATDADAWVWMEENAAQFADALAELRDHMREQTVARTIATAAQLAVIGQGDLMVSLPHGTALALAAGAVPNASGGLSLPAIDLLRQAVTIGDLHNDPYADLSQSQIGA